jgi:DNA-binding response OmpR family regulator
MITPRQPDAPMHGTRPFHRRSPRPQLERETALTTEIETSLPGARRLIAALAEGANQFVLTTCDGGVAMRIQLRLPDAAKTTHTAGGRTFAVDWSDARIEHRGRSIALSRTELRLLATLLEEQGRPLSRRELIERLWPDGELAAFDRASALAVYVRCLRRRLAAAGLPAVVAAMRGEYRFRSDSQSLATTSRTMLPNQ